MGVVGKPVAVVGGDERGDGVGGGERPVGARPPGPGHGVGGEGPAPLGVALQPVGRGGPAHQERLVGGALVGVPSVVGRRGTVRQVATSVDRERGVDVAPQVVDESPAPRQRGVQRIVAVAGRPLVGGDGAVAVAQELSRIAVEPVEVPRAVGQGDTGDGVEDHVGLAGRQQVGPPAGHEPGHVGGGAGGEGAANGGGRLVVLAEPPRRDLERGRADALGRTRSGDHLAEQGVDPQPRRPAAGRSTTMPRRTSPARDVDVSGARAAARSGVNRSSTARRASSSHAASGSPATTSSAR